MEVMHIIIEKESYGYIAYLKSLKAIRGTGKTQDEAIEDLKIIIGE